MEMAITNTYVFSKIGDGEKEQTGTTGKVSVLYSVGAWFESQVKLPTVFTIYMSLLRH
jgi:hypothetical protein